MFASQQSITPVVRPVKIVNLLALLQATMHSRQRQYRVRSLLDQLREYSQQLQLLAMQLSEAENQERRRVAATLHDGVQQLLAAALLNLGSLTRHESSTISETAAKVKSLLNKAIDTNRTLSYELSPAVLDYGGLAAGAEWLAKDMYEKHGLRIDLNSLPEANSISSSQRHLLFRILRELLFNVTKHAETDRAWVSITIENETIVLRVKDNGKGFNRDHLSVIDSNGVKLGLFSIKERVNVLGGKLEIHSEIGKGSELLVRLPLLAESEMKRQRDKIKGSDGYPIRVMIADDHKLVREGIAALLQDHENIEIIGQAGDGNTAIEMALELRPDIVLMDYSMPGMNGAEATRVLLLKMSDIQVIGMSAVDEEGLEKKMMDAGAYAMVPKEKASDELMSLIHSAYQLIHE